MKSVNSAHLGSDDETVGLTITDVPSIPADSLYPYNRLEAYISAELRGQYAKWISYARLEIVDDLLQLIDSLDAFGKRQVETLAWWTSGGQIELALAWGSPYDSLCRARVRLGTDRRVEDREFAFSANDAQEALDVAFAVTPRQIDRFLEVLREIASHYPQYPA